MGASFRTPELRHSLRETFVLQNLRLPGDSAPAEQYRHRLQPQRSFVSRAHCNQTAPKSKLRLQVFHRTLTSGDSEFRRTGTIQSLHIRNKSMPPAIVPARSANAFSIELCTACLRSATM